MTKNLIGQGMVAGGKKAGAKGCLKNVLISVLPPNKNSALIGGGAISAPGVDFNSVEI